MVLTASYVPGCVLYFSIFMSFGSITPFLPVIWQSKGMDDDEIGVLGAIQPISLLLAGPLICAFADKRGIQQKALYGLVVLFAITRASVFVAGSFLALVVVEASASVCESPVISLVDSAVRNSFGVGGYGSHRVWGAAGYGIAAVVSGVVYGSTAGYGGVTFIFVAALTVTLVASVGVPVGRGCRPAGGEGFEGQACGARSEHPATKLVNGGSGQESENEPRSEREQSEANAAAGRVEPRQGDADEGGATDNLILTVVRERADETLDTGSAGTGKTEDCSGTCDNGEEHEREEQHGAASALWIMFGTPQNACIFTALAISGMCKGIIDTFLFIWLGELGGSHVLMGLASLVMCAFEVPYFYFSGPIIEKIGSRNVVALSQFGYIVRLLYYSVLNDPRWVLPAEMLHGLTFAAMWAATTNYAHEIAPAHLRTTTLATAAALKRGLGFGLGSLIGGVMYSRLGARLCFRFSACLPLLALFLMYLSRRTRACGEKEWKEEEGGAIEMGLEGWERTGGPGEREETTSDLEQARNETFKTAAAAAAAAAPAED